MLNTQKQIEEPKSGASFRIQGFALDIDGITRALGHSPSHTHRQGELGPLNKPFPRDMWMLDSPLDAREQLGAHLNWLAEILLSHRQYLSALRNVTETDIYCRYTCYSEQASLHLSPESLRIFAELDLAFEVSIIFIPEPDAYSTPP